MSSRQSMVPYAGDSRSATRRARILIVDDRPEALGALEGILADLGQQIARASSGAEALNYLQEHEVAVVILDVQMPGLHGYETATLIRGQERCRDVPIIFITGHTEESPAHGYALGAADYLYKPVPPQALKARVAAF